MRSLAGHVNFPSATTTRMGRRADLPLLHLTVRPISLIRSAASNCRGRPFSYGRPRVCPGSRGAGPCRSASAGASMHHGNAARHFVGGQVLPGKRQQAVRVRRGPGRDDGGDHFFASSGSGQSDDADFRNPGERGETSSTSAGRDVEASRDDQLLDPVPDGHEVVVVHRDDVAGPEPAALQQRPLGLLRPVPVAGEDLGAATRSSPSSPGARSRGNVRGSTTRMSVRGNLADSPGDPFGLRLETEGVPQGGRRFP